MIQLVYIRYIFLIWFLLSLISSILLKIVDYESYSYSSIFWPSLNFCLSCLFFLKRRIGYFFILYYCYSGILGFTHYWITNSKIEFEFFIFFIFLHISSFYFLFVLNQKNNLDELFIREKNLLKLNFTACILYIVVFYVSTNYGRIFQF